ncbi:hypothetical protein niasHT_014170 [Heterodera trifolii]|uniref:RING-type domain-containing protein n=1 Tax=Heterodera trifolii TaxID=157864 RepID=A0ABD2KWZ4_9BILA
MSLGELSSWQNVSWRDVQLAGETINQFLSACKSRIRKNFWTMIPKVLARQLCQLDEVIVKIAENPAEKKMIQNQLQNDPALLYGLEKLFFIFQKLKSLKIDVNRYKNYLTASLEHLVTLMSNRFGIPFNEISNVVEPRKSAFMLKEITNLLNDQFENGKTGHEHEKAENGHEGNRKNQKWTFRQLSNNSNNLFGNWLNSFHKEMQRRRRRKKRSDFLDFLGILMFIGLVMLCQWLIRIISFCCTSWRSSDEEAEEQFATETTPFTIGEAHMTAFDQLSGTKIGKRSLAQSGPDTCRICLDEMKPGIIVKKLLACRHLFHTNCIQIWLKGNNNSCPICRTKIFTEYEDGKVELNTRQHDYGTFGPADMV